MAYNGENSAHFGRWFPEQNYLNQSWLTNYAYFQPTFHNIKSEYKRDKDLNIEFTLGYYVPNDADMIGLFKVGWHWFYECLLHVRFTQCRMEHVMITTFEAGDLPLPKDIGDNDLCELVYINPNYEIVFRSSSFYMRGSPAFLMKQEVQLLINNLRMECDLQHQAIKGRIERLFEIINIQHEQLYKVQKQMREQQQSVACYLNDDGNVMIQTVMGNVQTLYNLSLVEIINRSKVVPEMKIHYFTPRVVTTSANQDNAAVETLCNSVEQINFSAPGPSTSKQR